MQYNVDERRKKGRKIVDDIQSLSYHNQRPQQPVASPPLLSRLRNFNILALTSIGSFFAGPTVTKAAAYLHQDEEQFSGRDPAVRYETESNAVANQHSGYEGCFWLEDSQNCLSSLEDDCLTPVGTGYHIPEAIDYPNVKQLSSSYGTHDNLVSSDSNVFPLDAGALIKNDILLVQRTSSSYAHTLPYRLDVRHLFGDSRRSDTLDENNIQDSNNPSNLHDPVRHLRNPLQLKSTATLERTTTATLCATAAVFVPSSPAARALLSRNKSSMVSFQTDGTGLDTTSVNIETPPLTPDSLKTGLLSPASFSTSLEHIVPSYAACTLDSSDRMPGEFRMEDDNDDNILYASPHLLEVKEGKKREQPLVQQADYDTSLHPIASAAASDDPEDWYGLEYTLELSSRESQPSDTQSFSAGEHSKSRESWAAIHQGTTHPFFEDEDYYQWKNWHRQLDKQDERRKHKKGFAFKAHSKNLSYLFVNEMRTRDVLHWQKRVYGVVAKEVKERLNYITVHCPDPYFPPKKHDLGWYLKRSRSVGCIRELKAIEG